MKNRFPEWTREKGDYHLCLSNDIDSLLSCVILNQLHGYEIKYFYDFKNVYACEMDQHKEVLGVDIAFTHSRNYKTWDNHVTAISDNDTFNPNSANLNTVQRISRDNYSSKYAGSTLLQIMAYYNVLFPTDREALLVLLAIDSSYLGHYNMYFKNTHNEWFKDMGLHALIDLLNDEKEQAFIDVARKYNLKSEINVPRGTLKTNIDLKGLSNLFGFDIALPESTFEIRKELSLGKYDMKYNPIPQVKPDGLFSMALTSKNFIMYTK